jgi:hypothetical protein
MHTKTYSNVVFSTYRHILTTLRHSFVDEGSILFSGTHIASNIICLENVTAEEQNNIARHQNFGILVCSQYLPKQHYFGVISPFFSFLCRKKYLESCCRW